MSKAKKPVSIRAKGLTFDVLAEAIRLIDNDIAAQVGRAVNVGLTLRNWLIGRRIAEYELNGADRAKYGEGLLAKLSKKLEGMKVSGCGKRQLYQYLRFYQTYPRIVRSVTAQFPALLSEGLALPEKVRSTAAQSGVTPQGVLQRLSYTHIEQLVALDTPSARSFYEAECLRGNWSVRELKRQIASLYYERSSLSRDKDKLARQVRRRAETVQARLAVRDPYVFEFLGLKPREVMGESHLEDQLLDKLQEFLLELGHGFCFEARQKRILIGDTYGFVDLVFYHRILKCHVLVDLKLEEFSHENIGQLNTYMTWYRKHAMIKGDNPPVGILLCAHKDHALVEYALAGMDNKLFVSKYQLHLPKPWELRRELERSLKQAGEV